MIEYRRRFPFIPDPHPDCPKALPEPIYIFNYRHFLYRDYLLKHGQRFRNVLLSDVKDVVFQDDPFSSDLGSRLHVAMESTRIPIGECAYTSEWILAGYGETVFDELKENELSCAGTVLGPVGAVERYLDAMLDQIRTMRDAFHCADQAAHNIMLHRGQLEPAVRLYNFHGPVATVGTETQFRRNARGQLVNEDGSVIAIVHQYDRHPKLVRMFDRAAYPSIWQRAAAHASRAGARAKRFTRRHAGVVLRSAGMLGGRRAPA